MNILRREKSLGTSIKHREDSMDCWFRRPPIQRQKWGQTQVLPHVNWGDLFFDLFYVAGAYNLSYIIKSDPSPIGLLYVLGCFAPLMNCFWTQKLFYDGRFQLPDDILHVILEVLQLCFLATAVLHIRPVAYMSHVSSEPDMFAFCIACWLSVVQGLILNLEIKFWGVNGQLCAKYQAVTSMIEKIPGLLFITAATIYSGYLYYGNNGNDGGEYGYGDGSNGTALDSSYGDYGDDNGRLLGAESNEFENKGVYHLPMILMLCGGYAPLISIYPVNYIRGRGGNFKDFTVPMNITYTIHRFGEWTMLMLGESVLSLLIVEISDGVPEFYFTFYVGIVSVILLQYLYFKSQPHHADGHALRRSRLGGTAYAWLIQIYSVALIIVGVSYKMLLNEYQYEMKEADEVVYDTTNYSKSSSSSILGRLLAGGDSESKYKMEDRRQRIAYFFCASLSVVFACLDLMNLAHNGIKPSTDRCRRNDPTRSFRISAVFFVVVLRVVIILFTATACFYVTEPEFVALVGLAAICMQVLIRFLGSFFFPSLHKIHGAHDEAESHNEHQNGHDGGDQIDVVDKKTSTSTDQHSRPTGKREVHFQDPIDQPNMVDTRVNEGHWPNTTQPMSIPDGYDDFTDQEQF
mmetsp:Transcript_20268/g.30429  ORF Transcript_20268/g.30429 Transcript_20268/m.30429 type:complete len:631 (-) Transcript_20268:348-2240(-)